MSSTKSSLLFLFGIGFSSTMWGHSHLLSPPPRSSDAGLKVAPCGGIARGTNSTVVSGGKALTVNWQETINHPGKFLISLSMSNDTGFELNSLATVIDTMNGTTDLPHNYSTSVLIPDINCDTCTLRLIQSMEENPAAPTFYYSCADIKIVSSTSPLPTPAVGGGNTAQGLPADASTVQKSKFGGGCGVISSAGGKGGPPANMSSLLFAMMLPLLVVFGLRQRAQAQPCRVALRARRRPF